MAEQFLLFGVEAESNESTALPPSLRAQELAGCIVVIDAIGCQEKVNKKSSGPPPTTWWPSSAIRRRCIKELKVFLDGTAG